MNDIIKYEFLKIIRKEKIILFCLLLIAGELIIQFWQLTKQDDQQVSIRDKAVVINEYQMTDADAVQLQLQEDVVVIQEKISSVDSEEAVEEYIRQIDLRQQIIDSIDEWKKSFNQNNTSGSFLSTDCYDIRNSDLADQYYSALGGLDIPFYYSEGITKLICQPVYDTGIILILIIWTFFLLLKEFDGGFLSIIRLTKYGRSVTLMTKYGIISWVAAIFTIILYAGLFMEIYLLCGGPSMDSPVQCIQGLAACPFKISVGEFYILFICAKIIISQFFLAPLFTLCLIVKKQYLSIGIFSICLLLEYLVYRLVGRFSAYSVLHQINIIQLLNIVIIFSGWETVNVAGYPVLTWKVMLIAAVIFAVLNIFLMNILFLPPLDTEVQDKRKQRHRKRSIFYSHSIFWYEGVKIWKYQAGLFMLIILAIIQIRLCGQLYKGNTEESRLYDYYHSQMDLMTLENQENYIEDIDSGNENADEFSSVIWEEVKEEYKNVCEYRNQGINAVLRNQRGWKLLCGNLAGKRETWLFAIMSLMLALMLSDVYTRDRRTAVTNLFQLTENSRKSDHLKLIHAAISGTVFSVVTFWPARLRIMYLYHIIPGNWSCRSISYFKGWPSAMTEKQVLGIYFFREIPGGILLALGMVFISKYSRNRYISLLLSAALCLIIFMIRYLIFN